MGSAIRADKRLFVVKRQMALRQGALPPSPKPEPVPLEAIEDAIAKGLFTKLPPARARGHRKRTWTHG